MSLKEFHLVFITIVTVLFSGLTVYSAIIEYSVLMTVFLAILTILTAYYGLKFRSKIKKIESQF